MAITLFQDRDYNGGNDADIRQMTLDVGVYNFTSHDSMAPIQSAFDPDKRVSSLKIPKGYRATLFEGVFTGEKLILLADTVFLEGFNDRASSMLVEKLPAAYNVMMLNNSQNGWYFQIHWGAGDNSKAFGNVLIRQGATASILFRMPPDVTPGAGTSCWAHMDAEHDSRAADSGGNFVLAADTGATLQVNYTMNQGPGATQHFDGPS